MSAEILIYAAIAAGLVFWLRSILGTRHGDERTRQNPFAQDNEQPKTQQPSRNDQVAGGLALDGNAQNSEPQMLLPRHVTIMDTAHDGFNAIQKCDRNFEVPHFLSGAESAFVIIVEAFSKSDRETLKPLLSDSVYAAFDSVITQRENDGDTVETEIHAIRKLEVMDATLDNTMAIVTIRFVADETCVIRNKDGDVISGDPERITEMNDIWIFARDVKSKDPIWRLTETRDGEPEDHKTPIPDVS